MPRSLPHTYQDLAELLQSADAMRRVMNVWPPFLFASIHVTELSDDFRHARVVLKKHRLTANYLGTQYGGSLYSMTDPFWMLMVIRNLGRDYVVWDAAGEIDFVKPGRSAITAVFDLEDAVLDQIRRDTADGNKTLVWFSNDLVDADGVLVARVRKQVYIRKRRAE